MVSTPILNRNQLIFEGISVDIRTSCERLVSPFTFADEESDGDGKQYNMDA